ncbi:MAG: hypothetical protein ACOCYN_04810, partial [Planctomycetota bacterium]
MTRVMALMAILAWLACSSCGRACAAEDTDVATGADEPVDQSQDVPVDEDVVDEDAIEDPLLRAIVTAQQDRTAMQGALRMRVLRPDDSLSEPKTSLVIFYLRAPDSYHLEFRPEDDPESREWFIGNGEWTWHVQQDFADEAPLVDKDPVDPDADEDGLFDRINAFFRMEHASLREDFTMTARAVEPPAGDGAADGCLSPATRAVVELAARRAEVKEHLKTVRLEFDLKHKPVAMRIRNANDNIREIVV